MKVAESVAPSSGCFGAILMKWYLISTYKLTMQWEVISCFDARYRMSSDSASVPTENEAEDLIASQTTKARDWSGPVSRITLRLLLCNAPIVRYDTSVILDIRRYYN